MKKNFIIAMTFLMSSVSFLSCSSDANEEFEVGDTVQFDNKAMQKFDEAFNSNKGNLIEANNVFTRSSDENLEETMKELGNKTCEELIKPSEELLVSLGFKMDDLEEIAKATAEEEGLEESIPTRELTCYIALAMYEYYLHNQSQTRANAWDYFTCAIAGTSAKGFMDAGTRGIVKLAAKSIAKRLVPCIGWGWGITAAAVCLAEL